MTQPNKLPTAKETKETTFPPTKETRVRVCRSRRAGDMMLEMWCWAIRLSGTYFGSNIEGSGDKHSRWCGGVAALFHEWREGVREGHRMTSRKPVSDIVHLRWHRNCRSWFGWRKDFTHIRGRWGHSQRWALPEEICRMKKTKIREQTRWQISICCIVLTISNIKWKLQTNHTQFLKSFGCRSIWF